MRAEQPTRAASPRGLRRKRTSLRSTSTRTSLMVIPESEFLVAAIVDSPEPIAVVMRIEIIVCARIYAVRATDPRKAEASMPIVTVIKNLPSAPTAAAAKHLVQPYLTELFDLWIEAHGSFSAGKRFAIPAFAPGEYAPSKGGIVRNQSPSSRAEVRSPTPSLYPTTPKQRSRSTASGQCSPVRRSLLTASSSLNVGAPTYRPSHGPDRHPPPGPRRLRAPWWVQNTNVSGPARRILVVFNDRIRPHMTEARAAERVAGRFPGYGIRAQRPRC